MWITVAILSFVTVLVWLIAVATWCADRRPRPPYDPNDWLRDVATWTAPLQDAKTWFGIDTTTSYSEVVATRIESRSGLDVEDVGARLTVRARAVDGRVAVISGPMHHDERVVPGAVLPVRFGADDTASIVGDLSPVETRCLLLGHRRDQGLIDESGYATLASGDVETVAAQWIRPTGRLRDGHVEITVGITAPDGTTHEPTGFLRPHEVAAIRHTGTAPACHDDKGQWVLGPTWY